MNIREFIQRLVEAARPGGRSLGDTGRGSAGIAAGVAVCDAGRWKPRWKIEKYRGDPRPENLYAVEEFEGNLLLNEGITELLNLLIGGAATAYNNANARIGVGDSTTAAAATQTGLQAATNKAWKGMDASYPQVSGQTVTFRATFGTTEANFSWQEFTVVNAADDTGKNLCRKVENHGTKASGDTWIVTLNVTIS